MHHLLNDIAVAVLAATLLGLIAHWTRQPIILGYLIAGAVIGPRLGFKLVHEQESIEIISEIGLILLLFIIGLEMNLKALLASGKQLLVTGFGQFPICVALGIGLFVGVMGYGMKGNASDGLYLALMCGLSSTAVVVKLLYDKGELDTLPGRMTLGVLVVQDVYAILVLALQPNFANPSVGPIAKAILGSAGVLVAGFLVSRYVLKWVFASIARSPEMVVAVSIGWCAAVAGGAGALGLSIEMGALIAGLSIAAFPYSVHVTAKTLPLRDFFLTLFFVSIGMQITAPRWGMVGVVAAIVVFVIASRFLSIYPLLVLSGGGRRTAFIASLNLSQISEFSLVIAAIGAADPLNHISDGTVAIAIYAMAITAVLSSYAIRFNHPLYLAFDRLMGRLGRGSVVAQAAETAAKEHQPVAILGFHRVGRALVDAVEKRSPALLKRIKVIDFNTEVLAELRSRGVAGTFGDISSLDTLEHAHLHHCEVILCTVPDMMLKGTNNQTLVETCQTLAPSAQIVAMADDARHEAVLREEGADLVVNPHDLVADRLLATVVAAAEHGPSDEPHPHPARASEMPEAAT